MWCILYWYHKVGRRFGVSKERWVRPVASNDVLDPLGGVPGCPLAVEGGGANVVVLAILVGVFFEHVVEGSAFGLVFFQLLLHLVYLGGEGGVGCGRAALRRCFHQLDYAFEFLCRLVFRFP